MDKSKRIFRTGSTISGCNKNRQLRIINPGGVHLLLIVRRNPTDLRHCRSVEHGIPVTVFTRIKAVLRNIIQHYRQQIRVRRGQPCEGEGICSGRHTILRRHSDRIARYCDRRSRIFRLRSNNRRLCAIRQRDLIALVIGKERSKRLAVQTDGSQISIRRFCNCESN